MMDSDHQVEEMAEQVMLGMDNGESSGGAGTQPRSHKPRGQSDQERRRNALLQLQRERRALAAAAARANTPTTTTPNLPQHDNMETTHTTRTQLMLPEPMVEVPSGLMTHWFCLPQLKGGKRCMVVASRGMGDSIFVSNTLQAAPQAG